MADQPEPTRVTMEALKDGSYDGFPFQVGDTIEVEEQYVELMERSGNAVRTNRLERAEQEQAARAAAKQSAAQQRPNPVKSRKS
jgi:hypothetical protein